MTCQQLDTTTETDEVGDLSRALVEWCVTPSASVNSLFVVLVELSSSGYKSVSVQAHEMYNWSPLTRLCALLTEDAELLFVEDCAPLVLGLGLIVSGHCACEG
jgi:hypothetical protein